MSTIQLSFSLRVSSSVKTVHLLGSWDNYVGQLPLSKDTKSSKSGSWKGTFRFQGNTLEPGQRYWYYYILDGYHISHNPNEKSTTEPTTGRELNVLDVAKTKSSSSGSSRHHSSSHKSSSGSHGSSHAKTSSSSAAAATTTSNSSSRHHRKERVKLSLTEIPKGRPLSISQIKAPKPQSPHATRHILSSGDYDLDELSERLAQSGLGEGDEVLYEDDGYGGVYGAYGEQDAYITADMGVLSNGSPVSSLDGSDIAYSSDDGSTSGFSSQGDSSSSSGGGAYSSVSGYSTPSSDYSSCTCERYGITRKGDRVRIDCGGTRCGYEDSCSSSSDDDSEASPHSARRNGIVVRS